MLPHEWEENFVEMDSTSWKRCIKNRNKLGKRICKQIKITDVFSIEASPSQWLESSQGASGMRMKPVSPLQRTSLSSAKFIEQKVKVNKDNIEKDESKKVPVSEICENQCKIVNDSKMVS